jgi:FAD/FMN-containing dehydrogenase
MKAPIDITALTRDLATISGEVRFDTLSRALYSTDASVYQIQPTGVVIPKTPEDLILIVNVCRAHRCPVTMRGGGTSQAGRYLEVSESDP